MKKFFLFSALMVIVAMIELACTGETKKSLCTYQINDFTIYIEQDAYEFLQTYPDKKDFYIEEAFKKGRSKIKVESTDSTKNKTFYLEYQGNIQTIKLVIEDSLEKRFDKQVLMGKFVFVFLIISIAIFCYQKRKKVKNQD